MQKRRNASWKAILRYPLVLAAGWAAGMLLLWLAFLIPGDGMMENARRSLPTLESEATYQRLEPTVTVTQLDNYTDAWAINLAVNTAGDGLYTPWQRACNPYYPIMSATDGTEGDQRLNLIRYLQAPDGESAMGFYGLYWCGALIPVRLTLLFTDYQGLRIVNLVCQLLLTAAVALALWRALGLKFLLPLGVFLAAMYMPAVWRSIQFSTCFYLSMAGALYVALRKIRGKSESLPAMGFMVLGMLSAYVPFLTYPVVILGLPLLADAACGKAAPVWDKLKRAALLSVLWGVGFAGMWAGKWAICYLSGNGAMTFAAFDKIGMYQGSQSDSRLGIVLRNLQIYPLKWIAALLAPSALLLLWNGYRNRRQLAGYALGMTPYLLIALLPVAWMLVTTTHAAMHYWFTGRNFTVVFAGLCFMAMAAPADLPARAGKRGRK